MHLPRKVSGRRIASGFNRLDCFAISDMRASKVDTSHICSYLVWLAMMAPREHALSYATREARSMAPHRPSSHPHRAPASASTPALAVENEWTTGFALRQMSAAFLGFAFYDPSSGCSSTPAKSSPPSPPQFFDLARFLCALRGKAPRQLFDIGNARGFLKILLAAVFECVQRGHCRRICFMHWRCSTPGDGR